MRQPCAGDPVVAPSSPPIPQPTVSPCSDGLKKKAEVEEANIGARIGAPTFSTASDCCANAARCSCVSGSIATLRWGNVLCHINQPTALDQVVGSFLKYAHELDVSPPIAKLSAQASAILEVVENFRANAFRN